MLFDPICDSICLALFKKFIERPHDITFKFCHLFFTRQKDISFVMKYLIGVNLIRVSDLRLYLSCLRQIYFTSRGHELKIDRVEYVEHLLLRGLAFQLPMLVKEDRLCELGAWLDKIADELTRSILKKKIDEAISRIDIDKISIGLSRYMEDMCKMCRMRFSKGLTCGTVSLSLTWLVEFDLWNYW